MGILGVRFRCVYAGVIIVSISLVISLLNTSIGYTQDAPFPRPAFLKQSEVNVRAGPGTGYPILWIFQRQGWPVQLLAEFETWYKIRDLEGEEGWVYLNMVTTGEAAVISPGDPVILYKNPTETKPIYRVAPGVTVTINTCGDLQCAVDIRGASGYLPAGRLLRVN